MEVPGSISHPAAVMFGPGSPLTDGADVVAVTCDGHNLLLHKVFLCMWSSLFRDLIETAELAGSGDAGFEVMTTAVCADHGRLQQPPLLLGLVG